MSPVPEPTGHDLRKEWQAALRALGERSIELPQQVLAPLQRQTDLVQEVLERERRLQRELLGRALAPLDAVFDLLEQSGAALHRQAEALQESARALEQAAAMAETQAELFERAVHALRRPEAVVKRAGGLPDER
jgi:hypothetical protein